MMERRLERTFEWTELSAVLAEELLACMVLALSFPSQLSPRTIRALPPHTKLCSGSLVGPRFTVVRRSAPLGSVFRILLDL